MITLTTIIAILAITAICGLADRAIVKGHWGRSKPVLVAAAALIAVCYFLGNLALLPAILFALAFLIWRTPGWKTFGGSLDPRTNKELFGTFLRHSVLASGYLLVAYFAGASIIATVGAIVSFGLCATLLARHLAIRYDQGLDRNYVVELYRGLVHGLLFSTAIFVG